MELNGFFYGHIDYEDIFDIPRQTTFCFLITPAVARREGSMAKRPKPVHQLSVAEFERLFPDEDSSPG
jgi:hypothetical protein